jgi:DNA repair protein RadC
MKPRYTALIRDMPYGERPRERLRELGPGALSSSELVAILLRTGRQGESVLNMSASLVARFGGLAGLARVSFAELCQVDGISEAKASQVLAALELGLRMVSLHPEDRPVIATPLDVMNLLGAEMSTLDQEHLRVICLSTKNEVKAVHQVYVGNVNASIVRVSEIVRPAIRDNCPAIVVVHNHPSGDPTPSPEDAAVTTQIREGAALLDIELLDHIVIGGNSYASMKERGLGF